MGLKLQWRVLRSDLPAHLKPLALVLALIAKDDGTSLYVRVARLAEYLGRDRVTVSRQLAELCELGLLVTERRSGRRRATQRRLVVGALSKLGSTNATQSVDELGNADATESHDGVTPTLRNVANRVTPTLPIKQVPSTKTISEERKHLLKAHDGAQIAPRASLVLDVDFFSQTVSPNKEEMAETRKR